MNCLVCKSKHIKFYKIISCVNVYRCEACGVAFVDSATPRKDTSYIYSFKDYINRENQFRKRYKETLNILKKNLVGRKILEVGAGFGLLSSILLNNGYKIDVLEPKVKPYYLKNTSIHIIKKSLHNYSRNATKKYNAIILYDVLEHFDNPRETAGLFLRLVDKKGIILIQTPNYLSLMAKMVRNWSWWMIEDHRFFYTKKSLDILFDKKYWKGLVYKTHEEWIDFKKNLDGNFGSKKIQRYMFLCLWIPCYFFLRKIMWAFGKGGLITAIYQKI